METSGKKSGKYTEAIFHKEINAIEYKDANGNHLLRSGGSVSWRANNPGNLSAPTKKIVDSITNQVKEVPAPRKTKGFIGFTETRNPELHYFFIFPDYETGRRELQANIKRKHIDEADHDFYGWAEKHAGSNEKSNNPKEYAEFVAKQVGVSPKAHIKELSSEQFEKLLDAIETKEGYRNNELTRKELIVPASQAMATDGAAPIPDAQVQVKYEDGTVVPLRSDKTGKFPAIPHLPGKKAEVQVPHNGGWTTIAEISSDISPMFLLLKLGAAIYSGYTWTHEAPPKQSENTPPALTHRVAPGESLSKIAIKYHTTVDEIKKLNNLKSDLIHPEQLLYINQKADVAPKASPPSTNLPEQAKAPRKSPLPPTTEQSPPKAEQSPPKAEQSPPNGNGSSQSQQKAQDVQGSTAQSAKPASVPVYRDDKGKGAPIAPIYAGSKRAPWMVYAVGEAKKWAGYLESDKKETVAKFKKKFGIDPKGVIDHNYHQEIGNKTATLGSTAWCSAFVNTCLKHSDPPFEYLDKKHFGNGAKSISWTPTVFKKIKKPIYGAIVVYQDNSDPGQGHTGFVYAFLGHDDYAILGGNQGDMVCVNTHSNMVNGKKLVGYYVPLAYADFAEKEIENNSDFETPVTLDSIEKSGIFVSRKVNSTR